MTFSGFILRAKTLYRLGLVNLARVAFYRLQLRTGTGVVRVRPLASPSGPIFAEPPQAPTHRLSAPPDTIRLFGWKQIEVPAGSAPDWFLNVFTGKRYVRTKEPWYRLPDFDAEFGDIKYIWELSRWDWTVRLAQHAAMPGGRGDLERLNAWLGDWLANNPGYLGPNWKCGQEASIRILNLATAAKVLGPVTAMTPAMRALLILHLNRIAPTVSYAIGQDNNHGTSEAAALFVGGSWLHACGSSTEGMHFAQLGRRLLENRVARLIMDDGTFSQYSVNYHRLMLDTLAFSELWRRHLNLPAFSELFEMRAKAATRFLLAVVEPERGDAPLIGANDGARILQTYDGYRDHRPSAQLAAALFLNERAFPDGPWDDHLKWLGVPVPNDVAPPPASSVFGDGGVALLKCYEDRVFIRFPRARFRPGHADALHLDLWSGPRVLLSDGGTYSYNSGDNRSTYFSGTRAHNTVEFDNRDQMPRLSRFLFGAWLDELEHRPIETAADGTQSWSGSYRDWKGCRHSRTAVMGAHELSVIDFVEGFERCAILRWRLPEAAWDISTQIASSAGVRVAVNASVPVRRFELSSGGLARYYGAMDVVPVLEIEVDCPGEIVTHFTWTTSP